LPSFVYNLPDVLDSHSHSSIFDSALFKPDLTRFLVFGRQVGDFSFTVRRRTSAESLEFVCSFLIHLSKAYGTGVYMNIFNSVVSQITELAVNVVKNFVDIDQVRDGGRKRISAFGSAGGKPDSEASSEPTNKKRRVEATQLPETQQIQRQVRHRLPQL
jgi:hypothetical protein